MRKTNEGRSPAGILLPSAAAGLLTTLFLMLVGAVFVQRGTLEEGLIAPVALAFLALGCLAAAFISAKRASGGRFFWALGAGMLVFLILLATGAALLTSRHISYVLRSACSRAGRFGARRLGGRQYAQEKALQSFEKVGGNYHEACIHADLCHPEADRGPRRLRRMPDFLPVRLQDLLHGGQPEVRTREVTAGSMKSIARRAGQGAPCLLYYRRK